MKTVLDHCREEGKEVPAFCHDAKLSTGGHCRACLVEVDGRLVAACTTAARDGMVVRTDTPELQAYRRDLGELMLAESTPGGEVGATVAQWGATGERYGQHVPAGAVDSSHRYLRVDLDACVRCRRCVRACEEIQGSFVLAMAERGADTVLTWGGGPFAESPCVSCGACAATCPTDAISDVDRRQPSTAVVRTTCGYCGVGCQLDVHTDRGEVVRIEGGDAPTNRGHLCVKGRYAHGFVHHPDRLTTPLVRRGGELVPASWDDAMRAVAEGFARNEGAIAGLSSSRCTNEENYLLQKWFRGGLGTNDVDCCARVCHAPSAAGLRAAFGTGAATSSLADIEAADLLLVVGANPTEAHPVTGARLRQAALRGARLLVIDPRVTELAAIADVHLQVRPGGNVPLLNAIAAVILEEKLFDPAFVADRTVGFEALHPLPPEAVEGATGVPAALVRKAARLYAAAERPFQCHGLGVTEHRQGSEAVMLLANLALLVGGVGRPGAGVNPLRGQNNVQGAADMGCQPDLLPGYQSVADPEVRRRFAAAWGRPVPEKPGRTLPEMYDAMRSGELRALFVLGEDIVQTDPNSSAVRAALAKLDFLVVQELFLSETAALADVVLPGASFLEKNGTFTNGERRVQRVRRAAAPVARPDWHVLCDLMAATGWAQDADPAGILAEVARLAPMFAGLSYDRLDGDGLQWPVPAPDHPGTPILHTHGFPLGRARFSAVESAPAEDAGGALLLVTGRVLAHYNCGTMTRRTGNADLVPADVLEISASDAQARGIADGDRVAIRSAQGEAHACARISASVEPGTVFTSFHFPETGTNEVTTDVRDRLTGCPEYKLTVVEVRRA